MTQGMVQSGQLIIARGELVTQSDFLIIESLRKEYESNPNVGKNYLVVYVGQFLLISPDISGPFLVYLLFQKGVLHRPESNRLYPWPDRNYGGSDPCRCHQ